jgi:hypothetical protein
MAGVDLVREEVEAQLDLGDSDYGITADGLIAWDTIFGQSRLLCKLQDANRFDAPVANSLPPPTENSGAIDCRNLLYSNRPLTWVRWVEIWEQDQSPAGSLAELSQSRELLKLS